MNRVVGSDSYTHDDPLILDIVDKNYVLSAQAWVDPITSVEAVAFQSLPPMRVGCPTANAELHLKRPRGRPKKQTHPTTVNNMVCLPPLEPISEAQKTWEIAKMLGVTSCDEEAVLKKLRKSKRLLILEGITPQVGDPL